MRALILAAGLGTRLKPLTDACPKCMVDIGGKPILERQLDYLAEYGLREVIVNLHHLAPMVYEHFGHRYKKTSLLYLYEKRLLGEVGTLRATHSWLGESFVVLNADTLTTAPLGKMIEMSRRKQASVKAFDNGVYTGIQVIKWPQNKILPYDKGGFYWQDIGTREGLARARRAYPVL